MGIAMIHIVTSENRDHYASQVEQHFRIRHNIYVGERKWMTLARPDSRECDQFDNDDAIYVLVIDGNTVIGGSRLMPSLKPHLLSEVFPRLALNGVPKSPDIFEWTRVHVIKERREGRNRGLAMGSIYCGILEYCLANEITALTAIVEMWWLPHFFEMGWDVKPLGMPELIEGEWSIAIALTISEAALQTTRKIFGISTSVLTTRPASLQREIHAGSRS